MPVERDDVVPVAADLRLATPRQVPNREPHAFDPRKLQREHAALKCLRDPPLADALDHADEKLRRPVVVAQHGRGELGPDRLAVRAEVALLEAVLLELARDEPPNRLLGVGDVVGVGDRTRPVKRELLARAANRPAVRVVDLHVAALQIEQRHADRRLLERDPEALLARAQRRVGRPLARHVARDRRVEVDLPVRPCARDDDLRDGDLAPVAMQAREVAAPDAVPARDRERRATNELARPAWRELADPPSADVLIQADPDHSAPAGVDVDEVVVAVGDRHPVRRRLEHRTHRQVRQRPRGLKRRGVRVGPSTVGRRHLDVVQGLTVRGNPGRRERALRRGS